MLELIITILMLINIVRFAKLILFDHTRVRPTNDNRQG